jgi:hypothetical protein
MRVRAPNCVLEASTKRSYWKNTLGYNNMVVSVSITFATCSGSARDRFGQARITRRFSRHQ